MHCKVSGLWPTILTVLLSISLFAFPTDARWAWLRGAVPVDDRLSVSDNVQHVPGAWSDWSVAGTTTVAVNSCSSTSCSKSESVITYSGSEESTSTSSVSSFSSFETSVASNSTENNPSMPSVPTEAATNHSGILSQISSQFSTGAITSTLGTPNVGTLPSSQVGSPSGGLSGNPLPSTTASVSGASQVQSTADTSGTASKATSSVPVARFSSTSEAESSSPLGFTPGITQASASISNSTSPSSPELTSSTTLTSELSVSSESVSTAGQSFSTQPEGPSNFSRPPSNTTSNPSSAAASQSSSEIVTLFTSTVNQSSKTFITIVSTTALIPVTTTTSMSCGFGVSPVCSASPTTSAASSDYCLCPFCYLADSICSLRVPTGVVCPDGWICSITSSSGGTVSFNLPSGVTWETSSPTPWSEFWNTITRTDGTLSTTSVEWTASLSTSTISRDDGSWIEFPFRVWHCSGPMCGPGGDISNWFDLLRCLLPFLCPTPDNDGWEFPPVPIVPPIGPPDLAPQTDPTTHTPTATPTSNPTASFSGSMTSASSTGSSSSCSESLFSSCVVSCATVASGSIASKSCSTSCVTSTECSGTNTVSTTTTDSACSFNTWWNDPVVSASIMSWMSQFPLIPSPSMLNSTALTLATASPGTQLTNSCTESLKALCALTAPFTSGTVTLTPFRSITGISTPPLQNTTSATTTAARTESVTSTTNSVKSTTTSSISSGQAVLITSTTRSFSSVEVFTCGGWESSGHSSCTETPKLMTVTTTIPPVSEQRTACHNWYPFTSTTTSHQTVVCATPVSGTELNALPTSWSDPKLPFQPFKYVADQIDDFCENLSSRSLQIFSGPKPPSNSSSGECARWANLQLAEFGNQISIGMAFDPQGCTPTDKYQDGIDFPQYENSCKANYRYLLSFCAFPDPGKLGLDRYSYIGGWLYMDCMRFTVIAANDARSAPNTYQHPSDGED